MTTFNLSGAALQILQEGAYPQDEPEPWKKIEEAPSRKVGKGTQKTVTLTPAEAHELADYLWSVAQVQAVGEGRDSKIAKAAAKAVDRIEKALRP